MAFTKRCFSSVGALRRLAPQVLRDLIARFPEYAAARGLALPERATEQNLDYAAIRDALMAGDVLDALDDILYFASLLGDSKGWGVLQMQAKDDGRKLPRPLAALGHVDLAILAAIEDWPKYRDFLERANARARVHSRSAYVYYAPTADPRGAYRSPTEEGLRKARRALTEYLVQQGVLEDVGHGRGIEIIPYDFAKEVWFLIRHPGRQKRHSGCDLHGDWQSYVFNPEEYDAVAYNKVFADIRMNTKRAKDHRKYRMVFGDLLFGDAPNVFRPEETVVSLAPLQGDRAAEMFGCDDVPGLAAIAPVEVAYDAWDLPPRRFAESAIDKTTLLDGNRHAPRIVPREAFAVRGVTLKYRRRNGAQEGSIALQTGNRVNYERDGDSVVVEEWLRKRGFVKSFVEV